MRVIRKQMRAHKPSEITVQQFRMLTHLNHHKGASLSHMAEHAGLALPSMSKAVDCLVRQGLVTRTHSAEDRRCINIELTHEGQKVFDEVHAAVQSRMGELLEALSEEERSQLLGGVQILRSALSRDR